jgi:hypothetical protein
VLLGQVSIAAKVVSHGKTGLGDWAYDVKKYFLTVFAVGFVFGVLFLMGFRVISYRRSAFASLVFTSPAVDVLHWLLHV